MRLFYLKKGQFILALLLVFSVPRLFAQTRFMGKVNDEKGLSLPGVTVTEKGTQNAASTDKDGNFTIQLITPEQDLVFSMIGYTSQTLNVKGKTSVVVTLVPNSRDLNEVVVIGYGTQRKKDLTGSLASVGAKDIEKITTSSIDKALQGQIAGVQVSNTSGAPGGSTNVFIRGISTITGSAQPLYVVDGFPVTNTGNGNVLNTINPNDIQSVDVLKDASATAIYGSRASNGVIIITTKRGKEGKGKIDVDVYTGVQQVAHEIKMMNAQQFIQFVIDSRNNGYIDNNPTKSISDPNSARASTFQIDPRYFDPNYVKSVGTGTNWQDAIFRNAIINNYEIAASGGSNGLLYNISAGYFNQDGIIIKSNLKRYSFKANIDAKVNSKLTIGASFLPSYVTQYSPPITGHYGSLGLIQSALGLDPGIPVYNPDGSYGSQIGSASQYSTSIQNPVKTANEYSNLQSQFRLLANTYAEYAIIPDLKLRTTFYGDINYYKTRVFQPSTLSSSSATGLASATNQNNEANNWLSETTLSFKRKLAEKHSLDLLAGFTAQRAYFDNTTASATNFPNDLIPNINGGVVNSGGEGIATDTQLSWFGRANYSFADKYLITGTLRSDASSKFGTNKRWGTFPSGSIGWRVSQEKFMQSLKFISDMKIRAGYGVTGNNNILSYQSLSLLAPSNYVIGNALASGTALSSFPNANLSWETQSQLDIGMDVSFLNSRLNLTVDVYDKRNKDMLFSVPTAAVTGFSTATVNLGEVQNKGLEIALNTANLTGAFKWNTNFNIAFNRNKVLALNTPTATIFGMTSGKISNITQVGQPIGVFYGLKQIGVFNTDAEAAAYGAEPSARAGDFKYQDSNKDGKIDANDAVVIGNPQPKYTFGFNNSLSYKGFTLDINTNGQYGAQIYSAVFAINNSGVQNNAAFIDQARWRSQSDPGSGQYGSFGRSIRGGKNNNAQYSSRYIFDASYLRISQVNLGYNLPASIISNLKIQNARVYAGVNNLYTFSHYFGYDPEVGFNGVNAGSQEQMGVDFGTYPTARTFTLGIHLTF